MNFPQRRLPLALSGFILLLGCGSSDEINKLTRQVEQLTGEVQRLSGQQTPAAPIALDSTQGPAEVESLIRLESVIADRSKWPADSDAARKWRESVDAMMRDLSAAEHMHLIDRLLVARWTAEAFQGLVAQAGDAPAAEAVAESLENLVESAPGRLPKDLLEAVQKKILALEADRAELDRKEAITAARNALEGDDFASLNAAATHLDGLELKQDKEVAALVQQVRGRMLSAQVSRSCTDWSSRLERLQAIEPVVLRRVGLSQLYDQIVGVQVDVLTAQKEAAPDTLSKLAEIREQVEAALTALAAKEEEQEARRRRDYQRWALEQMELYEKNSYAVAKESIESDFASFHAAEKSSEWKVMGVFPEVLSLFSRLAEIPLTADSEGKVMLSFAQKKQIYDKVYGRLGWSYSGELAYAVDQEAAVRFLLPIEPALLEVPVQNVFSKIFQAAWKNADDGQYQLDLAKRTVTTPKSTLRNFQLRNESVAR